MRHTLAIVASVFVAAGMLLAGAVVPTAAQYETPEAGGTSGASVATGAEETTQEAPGAAAIVPPEASQTEAVPEAPQSQAPSGTSGGAPAVQAVPSTGVGFSASPLSHVGTLPLLFVALALLAGGAFVIQRRGSVPL